MNIEDQPQPQIKYTKSMIEWRRNAVLSKLARGFSQAEIAKELQLHPSTISLDVQFLRQQAQKELQSHIQEGIPLEYLRAKTGMNNVLKKVSEILEKAEDTKTKLESMKLLMELYRSIISLATDGGVIQRAIRMVKALEPLPGEEIISESEIKSDAEDQDIIEESDDDIPTEEEQDAEEE
jgi:transposase